MPSSPTPTGRKPPLKQRLTAPVHPVTWAAVAMSAVTLLGAIFGWWTQTHPPTRQQVAKVATPIAQKQAQKTVAKTAARLVNTAANAPQPANQTCLVPAGQGRMGACAPQAVLPRDLAGAVTAAASSVDTIRGHLIGADTSSYQGCVAAPRWISFWIVKATEGTGYRDRCTATDVRIAKSQHQVYGTYDFMRATGSYAGGEAHTYVNYVRAVGAAKGLHVLDVEAGTLPASTLHAYVCSWVSIVKHELGGQVVIYTGNWFWGPRIGGNTCGAILWDSAYASYAQLPATWGGGFLTTSGWTPYTAQRGRYRASTPLWQYSDGVYGPHPRVNRWDSDVFFGSRKQLDQLAGTAPRTTPCSHRTACRMGRRHKRIHAAIDARCHPAANGRRHRKACLKLRHRNDYVHRYAHKHHLVLVTK